MTLAPVHPSGPSFLELIEQWEPLLSERDHAGLTRLRQAGGTLSWQRKVLDCDDGRVIEHYSVVVHQSGRKAPLGVAGPVDYRHHEPASLIRRLVRSAVGQALAKLSLN